MIVAFSVTSEIVVFVSGLLEANISDTDFLNLEVHGLCIGGGSNVSNKRVGLVIFMKSTKNERKRKV